MQQENSFFAGKVELLQNSNDFLVHNFVLSTQIYFSCTEINQKAWDAAANKRKESQNTKLKPEKLIT